MSRRILITGATGGLGLGLAAAARAHGHAVLASGRSEIARSRIEAAGADFRSADLTATDLAALCRGCDSVIHAAALSASWGPEVEFERVNVQVTADLLKAARAEGCRRFVFVSSPSIFAAWRDRLSIRADAPPSDPPLNAYARTKLAAERLVLAAHSPAFATTAVRPRAIVGPDDKVLLPRLAQLARQRRMPMIRGGRALVEFTDVRDAAEAILRAEDRIDAIGGRGVNVSGGRPVRVREVAQGLAASLGQSSAMVDLPLPLAQLMAGSAERFALLMGQRREPKLTRYTLATLAYSQTFDMKETARLIGFRPRHDGLATLLDAARSLKR